MTTAQPKLPNSHTHLPERLFPWRGAHQFVHRTVRRSRLLGHLPSAGAAGRNTAPAGAQNPGNCSFWLLIVPHGREFWEVFLLAVPIRRQLCARMGSESREV